MSCPAVRDSRMALRTCARTWAAARRRARSASGNQRREVKLNWYSSSCSSEYSLSPAPARSVMPAPKLACNMLTENIRGMPMRISCTGLRPHVMTMPNHDLEWIGTTLLMSTLFVRNKEVSGRVRYYALLRRAPPNSTARCRWVARPKLVRGLGAMPAFLTGSHCQRQQKQLKRTR